MIMVLRALEHKDNLPILLYLNIFCIYLPSLSFAHLSSLTDHAKPISHLLKKYNQQKVKRIPHYWKLLNMQY